MEEAYNPAKAAIRRFKPNYENEIEVFHFKAEAEFSEWYDNNPLCHATWIQQTRNYSKKVVPPGAIIVNPKDLKYTDFTDFKRCDHHGKKLASPSAPVGENEENWVVKRRKTTSIKVGCKANLKIKCFNDDSFEEHVDKHINWKGIKNLLRLEDTKLAEMENQDTLSEIPVAMIIDYQDVQNAVLAKLNAVARKHKFDKNSVILWLEYLKENGYEAMLDIPDNPHAPLVLAWYSPWHKKVKREFEMQSTL